jgi:Bacterial dnaA protein helix-turn-helix
MKVSVFDCCLAVREAFRIPREELFGPSRFTKVVHARWCAMWLMHELTNSSFPKIGQYIGKDHTSVIYGIHNFKWLREINPKFRKRSNFARRLAYIVADNRAEAIRNWRPEESNSVIEIPPVIESPPRRDIPVPNRFIGV